MRIWLCRAALKQPTVEPISQTYVSLMHPRPIPLEVTSDQRLCVALTAHIRGNAACIPRIRVTRATRAYLLDGWRRNVRELVPPRRRNPMVVLTSPFSSPWLQVQIVELVFWRVMFLPRVSTITTGSLVVKSMSASSAQQVASAGEIFLT